MNECDHDKRFGGVFFAKHSCVACELEQTSEDRRLLAMAMMMPRHLTMEELNEACRLARKTIAEEPQSDLKS